MQVPDDENEVNDIEVEKQYNKSLKNKKKKLKRKTIFDKIIRRESPADIVYEDELCIAFHDIEPSAPIHILLVPKNKEGLTQLSFAEEKHKQLLGHMMVVVAKIAAQENLGDGFRIVINDGRGGGQSVYHLHLHILGCKGTKFTWPPGTGTS